jgi:hypothetical protein
VVIVLLSNLFKKKKHFYEDFSQVYTWVIMDKRSGPFLLSWRLFIHYTEKKWPLPRNRISKEKLDYFFLFHVVTTILLDHNIVSISDLNYKNWPLDLNHRKVYFLIKNKHFYYLSNNGYIALIWDYLQFMRTNEYSNFCIDSVIKSVIQKQI